MIQQHIYIFYSFYVTFRIMLYLVLMPLTSKQDILNTMSDEAKQHYQSVKKDRRIKGCFSIIISICMGIILNYTLSNNISSKDRIILTLFVVFSSMSIVYELMWQNRFIFEERDINRIVSDDSINEQEIRDIVGYSKIYTKSRYVGNIIEVMSVVMAICMTIVMK